MRKDELLFLHHLLARIRVYLEDERPGTNIPDDAFDTYETAGVSATELDGKKDRHKAALRAMAGDLAGLDPVDDIGIDPEHRTTNETSLKLTENGFEKVPAGEAGETDAAEPALGDELTVETAAEESAADPASGNSDSPYPDHEDGVTPVPESGRATAFFDHITEETDVDDVGVDKAPTSKRKVSGIDPDVEADQVDEQTDADTAQMEITEIGDGS